ncbi:MAG TPA: RlmE family RNA methyltransferase [bacterium]|nr:RlmE family RNA methyltransferase [bacterium]
MPAYQRKDRYFKKAKEEGLRSRAAFKLMEMNQRFKIFKKGSLVVDLGCSPGSWVQVAAKEVGPFGHVIGIDLEALPPFPEKNVSFILGDIREERTRQLLLADLGRKVDIVLSDMAPHLSGIKFQDHYNSYELAEQALQLCKVVLREGGDFVVKIFPGEELDLFKGNLKNAFSQIKTFIPDATRKTSTEIYLIAKGYKK